MKGKIYYLMKTEINKHGDMKPINYSDCPHYRATNEKLVCVSDSGGCGNIQDGNVIKQIKENVYLLQCNYKN